MREEESESGRDIPIVCHQGLSESQLAEHFQHGLHWRLVGDGDRSLQQVMGQYSYIVSRDGSRK